MQSSTPISPFHKGDKSFLWKRQPKSSNLLFMQSSKGLDFMQMNSVLIFFFWSLCLRDSVIFAQCAPQCLGHGWLWHLPHEQLPSSWCVGQCCAQTLTLSTTMAGCGRDTSHAWRGCRPLGVTSSRCSPAITKLFSSCSLSWEDDDEVREVGSPLGCECALRAWKSSITFCHFLCFVPSTCSGLG